MWSPDIDSEWGGISPPGLSCILGKTYAIEILLLVEVYRFELCICALSSSPDVHNMWQLSCSGYIDLFWKELHKGWIWSLDIGLILIIGESERNQMFLSVLGINISISMPRIFFKLIFFSLLSLPVNILLIFYRKEGFLSFSTVVLHLAICKRIFLLFRFICFL